MKVRAKNASDETVFIEYDPQCLSGYPYKITGPTIVTFMCKDEEEVFTYLHTEEDEVVLLEPLPTAAHKEVEVVIWNKEERHGRIGHRGMVYVDGRWDESSLWFPTFHEALVAVSKVDYAQARKEF